MDFRQRRMVTLAVMLGMFLAALDTTIVATALPTITRLLEGFELYPWVAASYALTMTAGTPVFGRLADRYGRRRVYLFGIAAFLAGSVLCGAAGSMHQLVVFRAIQGIGAGALLPIAITIVGDLYTLRERARIQGLFSGMWGVASIVGPLLGGFIVSVWSWRWIFYANLPAGLLALWIVSRAYREPPRAQPGSLDVAGALLMVASVVALLLGVEGGRIRPGFVFTGAVLGTALLVWERRAEDPVLPLELFRNRVVAVSTVSNVLVGAAFSGGIYYIPLFVQGVQGRSATDAGLALTPLMLGWTTASLVGSRLLLRFGFRPVVTLGLALFSGGLALLTRIHPSIPGTWVQGVTALLGVGIGFAALTFILAVQTSVAYEQRGIATSLVLFSRNIGGSVGVSLLGNLLLLRLAAQGIPLHRIQEILNPGGMGSLSAEALAAARDALAGSLRFVFTVSLAFALLALISVRWLPAGRPTPPEGLAPVPGE
ncbi:MAG: MDR family MFS transporter [Armatimonadota bacterium]|nr:MDR family MFS transporter [Armatimonadota bacterium]MDR7439124.1 MDR family MFS transporter [Armatimonadota bacterium]MDR7562155.1 MDR family MFS transporter [Armatimonadota bacterium]MDR7567102.1 MDR family MFS transporter [Armatimonadota bacterium]MDR7602349.1 MDR family MFS transporter [Armatimonadota bacterium]